MRRGRFLPLLGLVAAAGLAAPAAAEPPAATPPVTAAAETPPPQRDWTEMVAGTPEGGYRMGNPAAKVKLVEYGSFTCSHCATFSEAASEPLRNVYVKSGQVSWEFRPFLLFSTDPGLSLLLRCKGPAAFFSLAEALYAGHREWAGRLRQLTPAQQMRLTGLTEPERAKALLRAAGLDDFFRQSGMEEARIDACLADEAGFRQLVAATERANGEGVEGTPTFFINGRLAEDAYSWAALEPLIQAEPR